MRNLFKRQPNNDFPGDPRDQKMDVLDEILSNSDRAERTPGRPASTFGDTGLAFSGWYRSASETLTHASRDDDPRCTKVLCLEARIACRLANDMALNIRQSEMTTALDAAILKVYQIAEKTPDLDVPHTHNPTDMIS